MRLACVSILIGCLAMAYPATAKLNNSFLRGGMRICVYDDARGTYNNPTERSITVDSNDDCPETPVQPPVPPFATLKSQGLNGGRQLCTYTYLDRTYVVAIEPGRSCLYTPR